MGVPEKPTLIEQFVQLIPLRYTYAALVWTVIIFTPGFLLVDYLILGSTAISFPPATIYNAFLFMVTPFYLFIIARYLRIKVVTSEPHIMPIMTGAEQAYHSAFGRISNEPPVILLAVIFWLPFLQEIFQPIFHLPLLVFSLVQQFIISLAAAQFVWEYSVSSWGLHKLGQSQLRLKSFLEDRMMGARPIGSVALSSTVAYLGGFLLIFLLGSSSTGFLTSPIFLGFMIAFLALGIVMFFLPLNSLHQKMQAEKRRHQSDLNTQLLMMKQASRGHSGNGPASMDRVESAITELVRLKDLEITERRLAGTPTWPFDIQLLGKLITIILSVTAVLLSRVITNFLHI